MGLPDLYPAQVGSPYTTLAAPYTAGGATMTVVDATKLPDAPNIVCLAGSVAGEFRYTGKDGNILQGVAALPGTPAATTWPAGTFAFRGISAYDLDALREYARGTVSDPKLYTPLRGVVPNRDLVECAGYGAIKTSGEGDWGGGTTTRYFLTLQHDQRIRQAGVLSRIQIYLTFMPAVLTAFHIQVWRKDAAGVYNRIGHEDILSSLSAGLNTVDLATPVAVKEGDYIGYGYTSRSGEPPGYFMITSEGGHTHSTRYTSSAIPETGYAWDSADTIPKYLTMKAWCSAPLIATIGDSIIAGHPAHYSFIEATNTTSIQTQISVMLANRLNCAAQNMGIGGQTTTQIAARFAADVVALAPKLVIIEGGVNDIAIGTTSLSAYLANWTTMLDACAAADIISVCIAILPWTGGTETQLQTRDTWNAALRDLVLRYGGAVWVDASTYVGQFRIGGDANNLWDIQTAYNADGVHYNAAGHAQIVRAIADAIEREYGCIANEVRTLPTNYVADVSFGGDILDGQTAGETLAQLDVVYLKSDGKWWKADAGAEATGAGLIGVAMQAAAANGKIQTLIRGTIRNDAWAWAVGGSLYLSTDAGALTQTAPSGSTDIVRLAGVAYSADVIAFTPDLHYSVVT